MHLIYCQHISFTIPTFLLGPTGPPQSVTVNVLSDDSVSVTWSPLADDEADSYIIREINGFVNEMTVEGEENTTILSGLAHGMNYTFVVHALLYWRPVTVLSIMSELNGACYCLTVVVHN